MGKHHSQSRLCYRRQTFKRNHFNWFWPHPWTLLFLTFLAFFPNLSKKQKNTTQIFYTNWKKPKKLTEASALVGVWLSGLLSDFWGGSIIGSVASACFILHSGHFVCVAGNVEESEDFPCICSLHICDDLLLYFINILNVWNDNHIL